MPLPQVQALSQQRRQMQRLQSTLALQQYLQMHLHSRPKHTLLLKALL
jgi:hypothetical protein